MTLQHVVIVFQVIVFLFAISVHESAQRPFFTQGKVSIIFRILKNGNVDALTLESTSGRIDLDRAAQGGISMSNPFEPLPKEFEGAELRIRFTFYYNPEKGEIPGGS